MEKEAREAKEKAVKQRKKEQQEKAEKKKIDVVVKASQAKKDKLKPVERQVGKRPVKHKKFADETSSEDEDEHEEVEYEDSSEYSEDEYDALAMRCSAKGCGKAFTREERGMAVGCDMAHCGQWYHPQCTDLETEGKSEKEIQKMDFVCPHC